MKQIKLISFTSQGAALANRIRSCMPQHIVLRYARTVDVSLKHTILSRMVQQACYDAQAIVFIGAAGIAVRSIAPFLRDKTCDPAVLVIDDAGQHVIPILSGHIGGANVLALEIAAAIHATPVLTTATDVHGIFAVDEWARRQGLRIENPHAIRQISGALLRGESVGLQDEFPVYGMLPQGLIRTQSDTGILVSYREMVPPFQNCLQLTPPVIVAGIGCKRGKTEQELMHALQLALSFAHIRKAALCEVATITQKQNETGLRALCTALQLPMLVFDSDTLRRAAGQFSKSAFVMETVGVDNVCERAAVCGADGGKIVMPKYVHNGITIAFACKQMEVSF